MPLRNRLAIDCHKTAYFAALGLFCSAAACAQECLHKQQTNQKM
jgi:hypothetical protein